MTRIHTAANIARPIEEVFSYVTTPGHWPQWHPSSLGVSGATDHSLAVGEQVTEQFIVAGRKGHCVWTVTEREAPNRWVITTVVAGTNTQGQVAYTLTPTTYGAHFEREFVYHPSNILIALLDRLIVRRRVEAESIAAIDRLKAQLEAVVVG